ncbi:MAG: hypothetical protein PHO03_04745 [Candidatus Omnitrophica bacterium]|nr:hypothetical protein [Candidatus Omnitrophota bacterium]
MGQVKAGTKEGHIQAGGIKKDDFHRKILFSKPSRKHRAKKARISNRQRIMENEGMMVICIPS